jgi:GTP-dependent phosphoenolpyruvate carboxykinase
MSVQPKIAPEATTNRHDVPKTTNKKVLAFVEEAKALFKPEAVYCVTARRKNIRSWVKLLVDCGTAKKTGTPRPFLPSVSCGIADPPHGASGGLAPT